MANKEKKILISNFSYMFLIEIANYILPFIAIPYIVKIVGIEKFGLISFGYIFVSYFSLIIDYGFRLITTKDISLNRKSRKKLSVIFWKMYISQFLLFILSLLIFMLLLYIPYFHRDMILFIFAFGMVIGNMLHPTWFFQGVENMKFIAIMNFIARVFYLVCVFMFVTNENDFFLVPLFNSLSLIFIALISWIYIFKKYKLQFYIPKVRYIKRFFYDGWHLFLTNIATSLYSNVNVTLLGLISGYTSVGIYSLAEKIFGAIMNIVGIANIVVYPYLSKFAKKQNILVSKIRQMMKLYVVFGILVVIGIFISANYVMIMLFGNEAISSVIILQLLSFSILIRPIGQLLSQYMIIKNQNKEILIITFKMMILNSLLIIPFIYFYQEMGLVIVGILVQSYMLYLYLNKNREILVSNNGE